MTSTPKTRQDTDAEREGDRIDETPSEVTKTNEEMDDAFNDGEKGDRNVPPNLPGVVPPD